MEYGLLSLLPPLLAIIIAIITKQTVVALFLGVWFGATVMNEWNPVSGFTYTVNEIMVPSIADPWNASLILLVVFTGGFINVLRTTGAGKAFGDFGMNESMPVSGFTYAVNVFMVPSISDPWNASLILLVVFTGGFSNVLRTTGAGKAFGDFATKKVNTRQKGQNFVWGSAFLFSYTEP